MHPTVHLARLRHEQICKWEPDFPSQTFDHGYIGILTPFDKNFVDDLKAAFSFRRWIVSQRMWIVSGHAVNPLVKLLAQYFFGQLCIECIGELSREPVCHIWAPRLAPGELVIAVEDRPDQTSAANRLVALFRQYGVKS